MRAAGGFSRVAANPDAKSADNVLTLARNFNAPRGGVFRAWTDPAQMAQWWGPNRFTVPVCELDARPDGAIRIHLRGPDGGVHISRGVFHEVAAPERLAFTMIVDGEGGRILIETFITVSFTARGDKTMLGLQLRVVQSAREFAPARAGMREGWTQSFERLALHLRKF
jgi:uncharacterized protein YndB with AHSA1/START domain